MPTRRVAGKLLLVTGMAMGGVVAGHAGAYLAAIPSPNGVVHLRYATRT